MRQASVQQLILEPLWSDVSRAAASVICQTERDGWRVGVRDEACTIWTIKIVRDEWKGSHLWSRTDSRDYLREEKAKKTRGNKEGDKQRAGELSVEGKKGERKERKKTHRCPQSIFEFKPFKEWQNEAKQTDGIIRLQNRKPINSELADLSVVSDSDRLSDLRPTERFPRGERCKLLCGERLGLDENKETKRRELTESGPSSFTGAVLMIYANLKRFHHATDNRSSLCKVKVISLLSSLAFAPLSATMLSAHRSTTCLSTFHLSYKPICSASRSPSARCSPPAHLNTHSTQIIREVDVLGTSSSSAPGSARFCLLGPAHGTAELIQLREESDPPCPSLEHWMSSGRSPWGEADLKKSRTPCRDQRREKLLNKANSSLTVT
ncbi:unnamed protein product [Menidia menidia]|uniref:(Atlantic silverside) hypothetical protein n=1 Tax=Menidia menidia TaxID=238744 RepID=A0A8S4ARZ6_9TELE|nr:unnamed protein product [Menidia menidia]